MNEVSNAKPLAVFSGNCLMATCGKPTGFTDMKDEPLFSGDIVLIFTVAEGRDEDGEWVDFFPNRLTVVVSDEWASFSDGTFRRKSGAAEYFVMGIKGVPLDAPGAWRVMKVKGHDEAVPGERWKAYGFNYREAPEAVLVTSEGGAA